MLFCNLYLHMEQQKKNWQILLDLIILIILSEEYKLQSSSLCSFLHPLISVNLTGPYILLNTL
jgi:hypothetical protein